MANPNGTPGIWGQCFMNGIDVTNQIQVIGYDFRFMPLAVMPQNVGIHQFRTGIHDPALSLDGYRKSATTATTAFDLTRTEGNTAATDHEWIVACELGYGAATA